MQICKSCKFGNHVNPVREKLERYSNMEVWGLAENQPDFVTLLDLFDFPKNSFKSILYVHFFML